MADEPEDLVSDETRSEETNEADQPIDAGRGPTPEEEEAADRSAPASKETAENYEEAVETGANVKGEGELP
ncbi:hypothetical protein BH20ACT2_BH20ACT2_18640 [soil metagenome]